jgi:hypothetical protein
VSPTGVKWLWELHTQRTGGIIGDEMGAADAAVTCMARIALHMSWDAVTAACHMLFAPF